MPPLVHWACINCTLYMWHGPDTVMWLRSSSHVGLHGLYRTWVLSMAWLLLSIFRHALCSLRGKHASRDSWWRGSCTYWNRFVCRPLYVHFFFVKGFEQCRLRSTSRMFSSKGLVSDSVSVLSMGKCSFLTFTMPGKQLSSDPKVIQWLVTTLPSLYGDCNTPL